MASKRPGNPRRPLPCGRVDGDGEHAEVERGDGSGFRRDETPEEAARAIADALDFLARETAKLRVYGARDLIQRAAGRMREFAEAGEIAKAVKELNRNPCDERASPAEPIDGKLSLNKTQY